MRCASTLLAVGLVAVAPQFVAAAPKYVPPPPGPAGGLGLNMTPEYVYKSDFDFQSMNLALNQEWIELDLFHHALATFSKADFAAAGLGPEDLYLLEFMGDQEVGHATVLTNMLQGKGAYQCNYTYPYKTVREFVDFSQKLTSWGEAGVYGFLEHLDSRAAAEILLQSITTEARQQMIFRQWEGLFPMPVWHTTGLPQSFAWTLLAPYLKECPEHNPKVEWQNFPALHVLNNPDATPLKYSVEAGKATTPAITHNRTTPLSYPGREITLHWELPGKQVSYKTSKYSYHTSTNASAPKYAGWVSQLNLTYTALYDINMENQTAKTKQPGGELYGPHTFPVLNGTQFVVLTDANPYLTPFNLSYINTHVVAGPAVYQSG